MIREWDSNDPLHLHVKTIIKHDNNIFKVHRPLMVIILRSHFNVILTQIMEKKLCPFLLFMRQSLIIFLGPFALWWGLLRIVQILLRLSTSLYMGGDRSWVEPISCEGTQSNARIQKISEEFIGQISGLSIDGRKIFRDRKVFKVAMSLFIKRDECDKLAKISSSGYDRSSIKPIWVDTTEVIMRYHFGWQVFYSFRLPFYYA